MGVFISASDILISQCRISLLLIAKNSGSILRPFDFIKVFIFIVVCRAFKLILSLAFIVYIRGPPCWFEFEISD